MNKEKLREDLKTSMKKRDNMRMEVIRGILTAFTNELVAKGLRPDEEISAEDADKVLLRLAKQRKDSIEQFEKGGRPELAEKEKQELTILEEYLPEQMSDEEIQKVAEKKKAELGITEPAKKGMLMGAIMKELGSKADGSKVKKAVDELF
ncbi:MAG TPA: GatB/YqeY domain-containing protein [Candidatus Paceibacterota bacterium]|nr:GatB/YqeY domain-containing protein [Candidatus Paceibacterota bacterium]